MVFVIIQDIIRCLTSSQDFLFIYLYSHKLLKNGYAITSIHPENKGLLEEKSAHQASAQL